MNGPPQRRRREDRNPTISRPFWFGSLVTLLIGLVPLGVAFISLPPSIGVDDLASRLSGLEHSTASVPQLSDRVSRVEERLTAIREIVNRIDDKLDRLIERRAREP